VTEKGAGTKRLKNQARACSGSEAKKQAAETGLYFSNARQLGADGATVG
jgi:hypothetical protein